MILSCRAEAGVSTSNCNASTHLDNTVASHSFLAPPPHSLRYSRSIPNQRHRSKKQESTLAYSPHLLDSQHLRAIGPATSPQDCASQPGAENLVTTINIQGTSGLHSLAVFDSTSHKKGATRHAYLTQIVCMAAFRTNGDTILSPRLKNRGWSTL